MKMYFSFQAEPIPSRPCCLPSGTNNMLIFFCFTKKRGGKKKVVLQLLNLNISFCFMVGCFFSLATVANNFIICIALIAVIKQTQQMLTLRRASSQPRSQLRLCFFHREGGRVEWLCARLKRNYRRLFIYFSSLHTVNAADVEQE